jgi:hypothetical protein
MTPAEDEDEGDDLPGRMPDAFPTAIKAAGVIWVVGAALGLVQGAVLYVTDPLANRRGIDGCGLCCLCWTVDLLFLAIGYETINWRIGWTTAANGVLSILVGWAHAAVAVLAIQAAIGGRPARPVDVYLLGGSSALSSVVLTIAGVLALAGWRRYLAARAAGDEVGLSQEEADYGDRPGRPDDEADSEPDAPGEGQS